MKTSKLASSSVRGDTPQQTCLMDGRENQQSRTEEDGQQETRTVDHTEARTLELRDNADIYVCRARNLYARIIYAEKGKRAGLSV